MAQMPRDAKIAAVPNHSVVRAFAILKAFYSPGEWVAASEISRRCGIAEPTVHRFMHSLHHVGAVVRDLNGKYRCTIFAMPGTSDDAFLRRRSQRRKAKVA
jgi:DNA-binding IclR family transcriptional regulator